MNERVKELEKQCWGYRVDGVLVDGQLHFDTEKFAKLIVKECARVIDRGDGEMSSQAETIWCNVCRDDILKHFGVKE